MHWYLDVLKKYSVFSGRARRTEFWMFHLVDFVISAVLGGLAYALHIQPFMLIYVLALLLPSLGLSCRRLHDTGRSGGWLFISLIPLVGTIVLLVFMATAGSAGPNSYGQDPKQGATA